MLRVGTGGKRRARGNCVTSKSLRMSFGIEESQGQLELWDFQL